MTELALFQATVAHEPHERFLFYARFTPDLDRRVRQACGVAGDADLAEHLGMFSPVEVGLQEPEGWKPPDFSVYYEDFQRPEDAFINALGVLEIPARFFHFTGHVSPLRNARRFEDLESFPYPSVEGWRADHMAAEAAAARARGKVSACWIGHMYENAWQIRGYEQFLEDMILRPEWAEYILERLAQRNVQVARAAARAGVDLLRTGDDVANQRAMMFRPEQWRRLMKRRWARVYAAAREIKPDIQIWYHSDGNIEAIIGELIEIGVTILNPVQPECMDPVRIKRKWGKQVVLDGTIGTQSTMPFGSAAEVRRTVEERKRALGSDGALILSPTHVLEPEVPVENVRAFVEASRG